MSEKAEPMTARLRQIAREVAHAGYVRGDSFDELAAAVLAAVTPEILKEDRERIEREMEAVMPTYGMHVNEQAIVMVILRGVLKGSPEPAPPSQREPSAPVRPFDVSDDPSKASLPPSVEQAKAHLIGMIDQALIDFMPSSITKALDALILAVSTPLHAEIVALKADVEVEFQRYVANQQQEIDRLKMLDAERNLTMNMLVNERNQQTQRADILEAELTALKASLKPCGMNDGDHYCPNCDRSFADLKAEQEQK